MMVAKAVLQFRICENSDCNFVVYLDEIAVLLQKLRLN